MGIKSKKFLAVVRLRFDYDGDDEDTVVYNRDDVRWEMISWLEDLGFLVDVDVVEDREV